MRTTQRDPTPHPANQNLVSLRQARRRWAFVDGVHRARHTKVVTASRRVFKYPGWGGVQWGAACVLRSRVRRAMSLNPPPRGHTVLMVWPFSVS